MLPLNHEFNIDSAQLTPWSRIIAVKLTVTQLAKQFFAFYGT